MSNQRTLVRQGASRVREDRRPRRNVGRPGRVCTSNSTGQVALYGAL